MPLTRDRLRILRERRGLDQLDVARALDLPPATYNSYENGRNPKPDTLIQLAEYHGVTTDYILGASNDPKPSGGRLGDLFAALQKVAGEDAPAAGEMVVLLEAMLRYYRAGCPCGDIPVKALSGFVKALTDSVGAAAQDDFAGLCAHADAAVVAALGVAKMPALAVLKKGE